MVIVVMGPAGSGKSTVGLRLAEALRARFLEGDAFHSPESIARMRGGKPLGDAERASWLSRLAAEIAGIVAAGEDAVVACSALRRAYRRILAPPHADPEVRFVYLQATPSLLRERISSREGHFFPPVLLESQLADLEPPGRDEEVLVLDAALPIGDLVAAVLTWLDVQRPGRDDRHARP